MATLGLIAAAASVLVWLNLPQQSETAPSGPRIPLEPISIVGKPARGSADSPVVLIEFSDFECPICGDVARGALKELERSYFATGRVAHVFRHFPLSRHKLAVKAGAAAACAGATGRFWEMHDLLFSNQGKFTDGAFSGFAMDLGIDKAAFQSCVGASTTVDEIQRDHAEGVALGVAGTPTFFVGQTVGDGRVRVTEVLNGRRPVAEFTRAFERALARR